MTDESEQTRLNQMDTSHFEYRLAQLEQEMLPKRVQVMEITLGQIQGEVTAMKEIARGIGVKVDAGFEKLTTDSNIRLQDLKMEQVKNYSFVKGVLWAAGGVVGVVVMMSPFIGEVVKKMLGI